MSVRKLLISLVVVILVSYYAYAQDILLPEDNLEETYSYEKTDLLVEGETDPCSSCFISPESCPPECSIDLENQNSMSQSNGAGENERYSYESESSEECVENWVCTPWSECINGYKTRYCVDNNKCGTMKNKPSEKEKCSINNIATSEHNASSQSYDYSNSNKGSYNEEISSKKENTKNNSLMKILTYFFITLFISSLAGLIYYNFFYNKKKANSLNNLIYLEEENTNIEEKPSNEEATLNENNDIENNSYISQQNRTPYDELKEWIKNALSQGYTPSQIIEILSKSGWNEEVVKYIIFEITSNQKKE